MVLQGILKPMKCGWLVGLLRYCPLYLPFIGDSKKRLDVQLGVKGKTIEIGYVSKDSRRKSWRVMAKRKNQRQRESKKTATNQYLQRIQGGSHGALWQNG